MLAGASHRRAAGARAKAIADSLLEFLQDAERTIKVWAGFEYDCRAHGQVGCGSVVQPRRAAV